MNKQKAINKQKLRRRYGVRKKVGGSADRPRLCVNRSLRHIGVQLIDDSNGKTIASASTLDQSLRGDVTKSGNKDAAAIVGKAIAERALEAGIKQVRFDRGHAKYHGRLAALADAAREAGLVF